MDYPDALRELAIAPQLPRAPERLAREVVAFTQRIRKMDLFSRRASPETLDWAEALIALDRIALDPTPSPTRSACCSKYQDDVGAITPEVAAKIVKEGKKRASKVRGPRWARAASTMIPIDRTRSNGSRSRARRRRAERQQGVDGTAPALRRARIVACRTSGNGCKAVTSASRLGNLLVIKRSGSERNREDAMARPQAIVDDAARSLRQRHPTRPGASVAAQAIESKVRRGETKEGRRKVKNRE